ncbi:MAG TPA: carboxypeptidase regulatory-like domain-containing protein, partial [Pyrinomonadaceae bacterium]|nr:carboxypeptidase regulatory-like domain-containing protein [Pyrinomonadaceae bacterium]
MTPRKSSFLLARAGALAAIVFFCTVGANAQNLNSFSLADFEAIGDGAADDGPALQRALDAVAEAGGGTLFIPAGLYKIQTPVVRDFGGASVTIQGVPSDTMPAPPTASGDQLALSLGLASEFIPATGASASAITLTNIDELTVEHLAFTGIESSVTDAFITLFMTDVNHATVRHNEFYGLATFGTIPGLGGGNIIRAVRSELSIESTVFLGCAANSGAYAPIVDNHEWKRFSISNSIFVDYGIRSYFGKMGLGAPISWINFGSVAPRTPESSRREVVIRDTFLDEGGWIGITAFPHLWGSPADPFDLVYISGLKMNVSNLGTAGNQFYDVKNILIENSHYGWSHNTGAAIDIIRSSHAILDGLTCIAEADRIRADNRTERLTVINSVYREVASEAQTTTEMQTEPEDDPVQYVRQQFLSILGKQPEPAAHFYWSDLLIRCGSNSDCLNQQRAALTEYLESNPQTSFSISGNVLDENSDPLPGVTITLSGSQSAVAVTDALGNFRFSNLPTAGTYTVTASKRHYTFTNPSKTFVRPASNVEALFVASLQRHTISGWVANSNGTGIPGVKVNLVELQTVTATTDADGNYSFPNVPAGQNYLIAPVVKDFFVFTPASKVVDDLSENTTANFFANLRPELITLDHSDIALVFDSVSFVTQPFSIFTPLDFGDDDMARVVVFAKNLEKVKSASELKVYAEDANHLVYALPVEFVGSVPGQSWLKQVNIRTLPG